MATPWADIKAEYLHGVTPKDLAEKYGIKAKTIHEKASKESWVAEKTSICKNVQESVEDEIREGAKDSIRYLRKVVNNPSEKTLDRISAAKGLLSVSGLEKSEKKITGNLGLEKVFITPKEVKETDSHIDDFIEDATE